MKKLLLLAILCSTGYALQAPYLYTADSVADTAIQLTWRNNSTAYLGIIILRATATAGQYSVIDTAPGSATSFTDTVRPPAQTTYYYALTAYSQTEHADTSNSDSVRITPKPPVVTFFAPLRFRISWDSASHIVGIGFFDSSTVEKGYRVFRSVNFGTPVMIRDIPSAVPSSTGSISFNDSSPLSPNTWYLYYGTVYSSDSSSTSPSDTIFTFDQSAMTNDMIKNASKKCILSNKVGSFPIKYRMWSLRAGDTIVLNETGMPTDSMFSIINVSNPANPKFAGTGTSIAAQIDSAKMAGASAVTRGRDILGCYATKLYAFEYQNGVIQIMNSVQGPYYHFQINPCFLSDTILVLAGSYAAGMSLIGGSTGYSLAQYTVKNSKLAYVDTTMLLPNTNFQMTSGNDYRMSQPIAWNGKYVENAYYDNWANGTTIDSCAEIVDFSYSPLPKYRVSHFLVHSPHVVDGILFEDPVLEKMNNVMVDTLKNLVFALSDTELSIYSCQITGVKTPIHSSQPETCRMTFQKSTSSLTLISLPHHAQPAVVSIYDMSGKRIAQMEGIQGETVAWPHQNRAGVYIVRAALDGNAVSAKVVLTK
jgi:hypothetical protein